MSISAYSSTINKYPTLEDSYLLGLISTLRLGDKSRRQSHKDEIILSNLKLVWTIALKIARKFGRCDIEDLVQEGIFGLDKAVDAYDPARTNPNNNEPYKFSTYAYPKIEAAMRRYIENDAEPRGVRVPVHTQELGANISTIRREYILEKGREPDVREVTKLLMGLNNGGEKYSAETIEFEFKRQQIAEYHNYKRMSLSGFREDGRSNSLLDIIMREETNPEKITIKSEEVMLLEEALRRLDEKEQAIIRLRYGIGYDNPIVINQISSYLGIAESDVSKIMGESLVRPTFQKKVGSYFGLSQQGVNKIEKIVLGKLRKILRRLYNGKIS